MPTEECDYVVVGSGAGGGTVAARLAESGFHVVLLEAGGDPVGLQGGDPLDPTGNRLPDDYQVPAFHPFASENDAISWHFFVHHYPDPQQRARDPAYRSEWNGLPVDGVLYPRASCLGGCTAHNALILIAPPDSDWDAIADETGDDGWSASHMRRYFARLENCRHRWGARLLARLGWTGSGHGWNGWLSTEKAVPKEVLDDGDVVRVMATAALSVLDKKKTWWDRLRVLIRSFGDPNDRYVLAQASEGVFYTPLSTYRRCRTGARERVLAVQTAWPALLDIRMNALATRVLFDAEKRAIGVEYRDGPNQYRAHRTPGPAGSTQVIRARREVILSGGAFNTPQLLMLSGIGPRPDLQALGIDTLVDAPEIGRNLQDRYEAGVLNRMAVDAWPSLKDASFRRDDPVWKRWKRWGRGMYSSNGAGLAIAIRSRHDVPEPDLFLMSLLAPFRGYFPGYSRDIAERRNILTWAILKAHTRNRAGRVTLRSADPTEPPAVDFRYFDPADDPDGNDLKAVVAGIRLARDLTRKLRDSGAIAAEEVPGPGVQSDADLSQFVRDHAWGHHACGTCAIGTVLAADFRVRGTSHLRVVDASVFPRIPGYFIASAVYMVAEKAADMIIADAMG